MSLFQWDKSFSVDISQFDIQHQKLVSLLNQLHESMRAGHSKDILARVLKDLIDYTATHFAAEERLMSQYGYPGYPAHKKEHDDLVAKVLALQSDFSAGRVGVSMDTMNFLKDWLKNHILGTDRLYSGFLNGKGIH